MPDIRRRLARFTAGDNGLRVNEPECVDDHFSFHGLDGINNNCHRTRVQGLERLHSSSANFLIAQPK